MDSPSNFTLDGMFAPPFSQKVFSENQKKSKKSFRSLSEFTQEKKSRLKSDFSNLVKKSFPDLSLLPDIIKAFPAPFIASNA